MMNENTKHIKEYKDFTDFPAEKSLQVNNCGQKKNYGPNHSLLRPHGRKDYYLLYVVSGYLYIEADGELVRIDEGKCVVHLPGVRQLINFTSDGNPSIYYVHFTGTAADEAMRLMQLEDVMILPIDDRTMFEITFHQMVQSFLPLKALNGRKPISVPKVNGLLLQLIDLLVESHREKSKSEQDAIMSAMPYISEHYRESIDLEQCAAISHLSLSRFAHLFKEKMGISPYKFVLSLRIDEAKELLLYSSMSVSEVSESVGFTDPSYFSRLFRKYTGYAPTDYRNRV